MEILWWLVPSLVVTCVAMLWVGWLGREGRGEVDREVALQRLARELSRDRPTPARPEARQRDRSTGIAVRQARGAQPPGRPTRRVS
ncbi:hypothetical protein [Nocardioides solisilvae]|uniref:hypothetical protein n=1 Tax=Nocardioides solisilvae TaxID=1542435 RepID=UPI001EF61565|nr:hypothetical protein [Nocardioides solisilvae]